jgi:hypothetical protein
MMTPIDLASLLAPSHGASRRGWHRLSDWLVCPQKFAYRHRLGLIPRREPPARALGSLIHLGLMHHYLAEAGRPSLDPVSAMASAPQRIAFQFEKARATFEAYLEETRHEEIRVLDVEREFAISVGGHLHTQRFDLVVAGPVDAPDDGKAYVLDQKTTQRDIKINAREFELSGQFAAADLVAGLTFADAYERPFGGVLINAVATATNRDQTLGQRHLHQLRRSTLPILPTLISANNGIEAARAAGVDPWGHVRSYQCRQYGELCEYASLCLRGRSAIADYETDTEAERSA